MTVGPIRLGDIKLCVDVEFLESSIALRFPRAARNYEFRTDNQVQTFLDNLCKKLKESITLESLNSIVKNELQTNMKHSNATARMKDIFAD